MSDDVYADIVRASDGARLFRYGPIAFPGAKELVIESPSDETVTVTHDGHDCEHTNGWHITVPFMCFWRRRLFVCSDCGHWERAA